MFKQTVRRLKGPITDEILTEVRGLNFTREKNIDTVTSIAAEIGDFDFLKLFKRNILTSRNAEFFRLMSNCFKNWLFRNSGLNGLETFSDISKLLDPDFFMTI